jgi:hypothetical protein
MPNKLPFTIISLDDVDEKYRDFYEEVDDGSRYEFRGVSDMPTSIDISKLRKSLEKERLEHKATKSKWSQLNMSPDDIQALIDQQYAQSDNHGSEKDYELKIRSKVAPIERERDMLKSKYEEAMSQIEQYNQMNITRMIQDEIRSAVSKSPGFQNTAVDDAMMYASQMFEVTDDGAVITKGLNGTTAGVSAQVWLTEMQNKKPHWWGPSQGAGSSGSRYSGNGQVNPWKKETWNLTEQGKIYKSDPSKAEQMAKSAGVKLW